MDLDVSLWSVRASISCCLTTSTTALAVDGACAVVDPAIAAALSAAATGEACVEIRMAVVEESFSDVWPLWEVSRSSETSAITRGASCK